MLRHQEQIMEVLVLILIVSLANLPVESPTVAPRVVIAKMVDGKVHLAGDTPVKKDVSFTASVDKQALAVFRDKVKACYVVR